MTAVVLVGLVCPSALSFAQESADRATDGAADGPPGDTAKAPDQATDDSNNNRSDYGERRQGDEADLDYRWKTAGRHYVVPLAFFSIHGYLEGVFAAASRDWTTPDPTQLPNPGQLLIPNTNKSSFQYDAAIFIATDTSSHARSLVEMHLVSDPSGSGAAGPGGVTLAVTEASVSWDLYKSYITLGAGLFWAPFGIVNIDWLGGQNLFPLVPRASGAFPAHFNERGVRINGSKSLASGFGVNYVVSFGNGVNSYDLTGQTAFDFGNNKTLIGRIGMFPGLGPDLELGFSYATGSLREEPDLTIAENDPLRYPGHFSAWGGDLTWLLGDLKLRSYYISSVETLVQAAAGEVNPPDLERQGFMLESSYQIWVDLPLGNIRTIVPKARFDWVSIDALADGGAGANNYQSSVYSLGVDLRSAGTVGAVLSLEYHFQEELRALQPLDNNRFVARLLARF